MLVLSRKEEEAIIVGNVRITIVAVRGGRVKVGINAPKEVQIVREELVGRERRGHRGMVERESGDPALRRGAAN
jgi:carbon storage regulator